jgi:hypothetical protein
MYGGLDVTKEEGVCEDNLLVAQNAGGRTDQEEKHCIEVGEGQSPAACMAMMQCAAAGGCSGLETPERLSIVSREGPAERGIGLYQHEAGAHGPSQAPPGSACVQQSAGAPPAGHAACWKGLHERTLRQEKQVKRPAALTGGGAYSPDGAHGQVALATAEADVDAQRLLTRCGHRHFIKAPAYDHTMDKGMRLVHGLLKPPTGCV